MALRLEGVGKRVGAEVHVHPTDLSLETGRMHVLLGPTLAGKTTLMRLMAGLDRPTEGRLSWDGRDVTGVRVQDRGVAMVYQQFVNYPAQTVYENIASPLRLRGLPRAEVDRRVRQAAGLVQLDDRQLAKKPLELSGGQQQRCAIARALARDAKLVLLDEPLANLDYKLREELREELPRIFAEQGAVFVYATTEPHEALLLGGWTATMHEGRVTQFGPTPEVYRRPADMTTARVFSDPPMNFAPAVKAGGTLRVAEAAPIPAGRFAALPDGAYTAGFRPDRLRLRAAAPDCLSFRATVAITEITGSESFVHVDHGPHRWVALAHGVFEPKVGAEGALFVSPSQLFLFDAAGRLAAAPEGAAARAA
jgi:glycerol transport system ATP-binding protein